MSKETTADISVKHRHCRKATRLAKNETNYEFFHPMKNISFSKSSRNRNKFLTQIGFHWNTQQAHHIWAARGIKFCREKVWRKFEKKRNSIPFLLPVETIHHPTLLLYSPAGASRILPACILSRLLKSL